MHFQSKASFFLTHCWSVLILLFCLFLFFTGIYSSAITKLRINKLFFSSLSIWPLIKSCDITKEFMVWKLQAVFFSIFEEIKFEVDTSSIILSCLFHFGKAKKELFLFSKFFHMENYWGQRSLEHIAVTKILKCFMTNGCRKWKIRF